LAKLADALRALARHRAPIFGTALPALRDTSARDHLEQFAQRLRTLDALEDELGKHLALEEEPPAASAVRELKTQVQLLDEKRSFTGTVAGLLKFATARYELARLVKGAAEAAQAFLADAGMSG